MNNGLTKKYGLFTAISMVIGIVIGSGVFFKAESVLRATGGNMLTGIFAWSAVGLIMIICSCTFAILASKYEKVNGIVDYAEAALGKKYGYYVGWFMIMIYYPSLCSVLAWLSARYLCVLLNFDISGGSCMTLSFFFLCLSYAVNALSPSAAGKFQVASTVIKLIPLILMAVAGTIFGLINGVTADNFSSSLTPEIISSYVSGYTPSASPLTASVVSVAFAYEGWIITTSINAELKNSKKNLPIALVFGSLAVVFIYIFYYIGLAGGINKLELIISGQNGVKHAFSAIFGKAGGTILTVFIIISCLGTLNGVMLACTRGMYSLAVRGEGPCPKIFSKTDSETGMSSNSAVFGLVISALWLVFFYGANIAPVHWFGNFSFDSSELPIISLYALYIPIFFTMMLHEKNLNVFKRFCLPSLSILSCIFMVWAAFTSHRLEFIYYIIVFTIIMALGRLFENRH